MRSGVLLGLSFLVALGALGFAAQQFLRRGDLETHLEAARRSQAEVEGQRDDLAGTVAELERQNQALQSQVTLAEAGRQRLVDERDEKSMSNKEPTVELAGGAEKKPSGEARKDTAAEGRFLYSLQDYVEDAEFLDLDDLSEREQALFGAWSDRMTMIRGADGRIGLFGLPPGDGKGLSSIPEELEPWVEAYAAVSVQFEAQQSRVVDALLPDAPRFSSKGEAGRYQAEQRSAFFEEQGRDHRGFVWRSVDGGGFALVERDLVESDPALAPLVETRNQIRARLADRESGRGIMEKWTDPMPDEPSDGTP